jgi:effector-binding domain-containing protein
MFQGKIREYLAEIRTKYNLTYEEFDKLYQEVFDFISTYERVKEF